MSQQLLALLQYACEHYKRAFSDFFNLLSNLMVPTLMLLSEISDLGLLNDHKISWNPHVNKISSKANEVLGFIRRNCRELRDETTLRTIYCALVRPVLEYGSTVWLPFTSRNITKLERVQRRATNFILRTEDDYVTRNSKLHLLSLEVFFFMHYFSTKL